MKKTYSEHRQNLEFLLNEDSGEGRHYGVNRDLFGKLRSQGMRKCDAELFLAIFAFIDAWGSQKTLPVVKKYLDSL